MVTKRFEILDHTADAKFKSYGKTLDEAFINAADAMFSIILRDQHIAPKKQKEFTLTTDAKEKLLYDFLDELLFIMDTESLVLSTIESLKIQTVKPNVFKLTCRASFDKAVHYDIGGNIKAVTYSEIIIQEKKDKVMLQVVVDI